MLLSQKIIDLEEDTNKVTGFSGKMMKGFERIRKLAEELEARDKKLKEIEDGIAKFYSEEDEGSDLTTIGEWIITQLGYYKK